MRRLKWYAINLISYLPICAGYYTDEPAVIWIGGFLLWALVVVKCIAIFCAIFDRDCAEAMAKDGGAVCFAEDFAFTVVEMSLLAYLGFQALPILCFVSCIIWWVMMEKGKEALAKKS